MLSMNIIYKTLHLLVSLLFISFAYMQFNDVDGKRWVIIYASVALLAILKLLNKSNILINYFLIGLFVSLLLSNADGLTDWLSAGKPAFIDYAPTDIKEVEGIREFLGLVISFLVVASYTFFQIKGNRKRLTHT